jgi:hypothetical protein
MKRPRHTNTELFSTVTLEPLGPVNVFNEKYGYITAVNDAIAAKSTYDTAHPPVVPDPPPPPPAPLGAPISAGRPVQLTKAQQKKYVTDTTRVMRRQPYRRP